MNTTSKLGLNLPEGTDWADVAKLNENFEKLDAAVSTAQSADGYDASRSYAVGDYCLHDGTLYRCTTATAGEAWNAAHWAATTLAAELQVLYAAVAGCAPLTHAARHAAGGADAITLAAIGAAAAGHTHTPERIGAAGTKTLTCTVPVSWTASGSYYSQTVAVAGMLAADNPIADILPGTDNDANKLYAEAWSKVQSITTLAGKVTIWCTETPAVAFPVQFKVVR